MIYDFSRGQGYNDQRDTAAPRLGAGAFAMQEEAGIPVDKHRFHLADVRAFAVGAVTDVNGNTTTDHFDALCRVISNVGSQDTEALPTTKWEYSTAAAPLSTTTRVRLKHGAPETSDEVQYFDGRGRVICTIVPGGSATGGAYIQSGQCSYNARGNVALSYGPFIVPDQKLHAPPDGAPQTTFAYDGLGRIIEQVDPSAGRKRISYAPDVCTMTDDVVGGTISRVMTQYCDSLGRVTAVQKTLSGRAVKATYEYDSLGNLVAVHDADAGISTFAYGLLGRRIMQNTVDAGQVVFVIDANGNQTERRSASGATLTYSIDELDRLVSARASTPGSADINYTYLKPGDAAPADGVRNRMGRLWKVDDTLGTLIHAYDAYGRAIQTRRTVSALGREFVTDFVLDAAGRQVSTTLPEPSPGAGRTTVTYTYDPRGVPTSATGFMKSASYDLNGRLFDWTLENKDVLQLWLAVAGNLKRP